MELTSADIAAVLVEYETHCGVAVASLERDQFLAAQAALARLSRLVERENLVMAAETTRRSARDLGAGSLARELGYRSPTEQIAAITDTSIATAAKLVKAGQALLQSEPPAAPTLGTHPTPASGFPNVAKALQQTTIGTEHAALIVRALNWAEKLRPDEATIAGAAADSFRSRLAKLERDLAEIAQTVTVEDFKTVCARERAAFDPGNWAKLEEALYDERKVTIYSNTDGATVITASLPGPLALPVIAFLDGQVSEALRRRRDDDGVIEDERTPQQMRADALVALARHGIGCKDAAHGVKSLVVVRVPYEALLGGEGLADADGLTAPISASAARLACADASIIPLVMGGDSQVLDCGREVRFFSPYQRIALGERDGGCASCHAPLAWCEAHHIRWWHRDTGPTDLSNGVMLCATCHHRLHRDGWEIEVRGDEVWFTPPATVDPARAPRLGGRAALRVRPRPAEEPGDRGGAAAGDSAA